MVYGRRPYHTAAYHYTRERELAATRQAARERIHVEYEQGMKEWKHKQDLQSRVCKPYVPIEEQPGFNGYDYSIQGRKRKIAIVGASALSLLTVAGIGHFFASMSDYLTGEDALFGLFLGLGLAMGTVCSLGAWVGLYKKVPYFYGKKRYPYEKC